jgi:hypothetical protein
MVSIELPRLRLSSAISCRLGAVQAVRGGSRTSLIMVASAGGSFQLRAISVGLTFHQVHAR